MLGLLLREAPAGLTGSTPPTHKLTPLGLPLLLRPAILPFLLCSTASLYWTRLTSAPSTQTSSSGCSRHVPRAAATAAAPAFVAGASAAAAVAASVAAPARLAPMRPSPHHVHPLTTPPPTACLPILAGRDPEAQGPEGHRHLCHPGRREVLRLLLLLPHLHHPGAHLPRGGHVHKGGWVWLLAGGWAGGWRLGGKEEAGKADERHFWLDGCVVHSAWRILPR